MPWTRLRAAEVLPELGSTLLPERVSTLRRPGAGAARQRAPLAA
jgi:hypothetical protein